MCANRFANLITLLEEFEDYITQRGDDPSDWYCGMTDDLDRRLEDHGVKKGTPYCYKDCLDAGLAQSIETSLIHVLGCQGDGSWGDDCRFVYAFKMSEQTVPC